MSLSVSTRLAPQDLPPDALRKRIANATRAAVRQAAGPNRRGTERLCDCVLCAYAGLIVTSAFTGRNYEASVGSLQIRVAKHNERLFLDARTHAIGPAQYHAWFATRHPGGRMEVADLCAHHYPAQIDHCAPAWSGGIRPWYAWGWADTLLPDIRFAADTAARDHACAWYNHHLDLVHGIAEHAFSLLSAGRLVA